MTEESGEGSLFASLRRSRAAQADEPLKSESPFPPPPSSGPPSSVAPGGAPAQPSPPTPAAGVASTAETQNWKPFIERLEQLESKLAAAGAGPAAERIAILEKQLREAQEKAIAATTMLHERDQAQKAAQRDTESLLQTLSTQRRSEELDRQMRDQMAAHRKRIEELEEKLLLQSEETSQTKTLKQETQDEANQQAQRAAAAVAAQAMRLDQIEILFKKLQASIDALVLRQDTMESAVKNQEESREKIAATLQSQEARQGRTESLLRDEMLRITNEKKLETEKQDARHEEIESALEDHGKRQEEIESTLRREMFKSAENIAHLAHTQREHLRELETSISSRFHEFESVLKRHDERRQGIESALREEISALAKSVQAHEAQRVKIESAVEAMRGDMAAFSQWPDKIDDQCKRLKSEVEADFQSYDESVRKIVSGVEKTISNYAVSFEDLKLDVRNILSRLIRLESERKGL